MSLTKDLKEFYQCVQEFIEIVCLKFNLVKSDFTDDPYKFIGKTFPKSGLLKTADNEIKYAFHGAGCDFWVNNLVVRYDFAPFINYNIKVSSWKFLQFVYSKHPDLKTTFSHEDLIAELENSSKYESFFSKHEMGFFYFH